jgi:hypothetical protein
MENAERKLSLHRPMVYQIQVPGHPGERWPDWIEGLTVAAESDDDGRPITTLRGEFDQAALQGLLRRLYSLGLPLISVHCLE